VSFPVYDFLNRKRRGEELGAEEINAFIGDYMADRIADYQMSAFLMAVAIRGMSARETAALTSAMLHSGDEWNLRREFDFVADKHSTGGVGDKVSMILTPWVASCGINVAMLSGRGLGHTGGTLDKLETIPGFRARLSREEVIGCIRSSGGVIATSTTGIAPADRRMYSLRDVTGTVESIPLITASIMSKKLALGATALILDVKTGSGAFMREVSDARALALSLIAAARGSGTKVEALITNMDAPLGRTAGNANEIAETFDVLAGRQRDDLYEVTLAQCVRILVMSGRFDASSATAALEKAIAGGEAIERTKRWIESQGGDPRVVDDPSLLAQPSEEAVVRAERDGVVAAIDSYEAGMCVVDLGGGRRRAEDTLDPAAGILFERKVGDAVRRGDVVARLHASKTVDARIVKRLGDAFTISESAAPRPMIFEIITEDSK
jgi:pyrimidine-nucleoside phosphorylase